MSRRRLGRFSVGTEFVDTDSSLASTIATMRFLPIRVEHREEAFGFVYVGLSHMFREVPLGEAVPTYDIIVEDEGVKVVEIIPGLVCYQCHKATKYLFDDARCKDCTRLTPEEVRGE